MKRILGRLTYANVMATVALFVALGGAGYAAIKLPKNSVGAAQLKKRAVTPAKLSKASKAAMTGPRGATGPEGPRGATGAPGAVAGPSNLFRRSTYEEGSLPSGHITQIGGLTFTPAKSGEALVFTRGFCDVELQEPNHSEADVWLAHNEKENQPNAESGRLRLPVGKPGDVQGYGYTAERTLPVTAGVTESIGVFGLTNSPSTCSGSVTVIAIF